MGKTTKPKKPEAISENTFTYKGKTYQVILPQVVIPQLGKRTAMEICVDEEAQQYLVENNTEGSVLKSIK